MNLENTAKQIKNLPYDLKVEAIIACFLNTEEDLNKNFIIAKEGQSKRAFRKDVLESEITDFDIDSKQFIKISLSRDGIYDTLPESFFHYPKQDKLKKGVHEMVHEYKRRKEEEENARLFFQPFESEFFYHALIIENQEKELLFELNGSKPFDFLYDFWGINRSLPKILTAKFLRLLPYAYKIVGNIDLTKKCLEYMIEEPVEINTMGYKDFSTSDEMYLLGESRLGIDMVVGNTYQDLSYHLQFNIGPIQRLAFTEYIHDGEMKEFLDVFFKFFLPVEIDYTTQILLPEEIEVFDLSQNPYLGITTRI